MLNDRVVIVGGGVIGSSIAYHLTRRDFSGKVAVIERDPTYRRASSALAMGGIRQQFSSLANIRLAQHSIRFYAHFSETLRTPSCTPDAGFQQRGHLLLVNDAMAERFEQRLARQRELGAKVNRLATADGLPCGVQLVGAYGPHARANRTGDGPGSADQGLEGR